ncbi:MAG: hypothetical protein F6K31_32400 [Symploca sp. SIO2G7]|nr:hypothetical protein [Symploca sp. SIO2G7]
MLKPSNLITVACCLLPVAYLHRYVFDRRARSKSIGIGGLRRIVNRQNRRVDLVAA